MARKPQGNDDLHKGGFRQTQNKGKRERKKEEKARKELTLNPDFPSSLFLFCSQVRLRSMPRRGRQWTSKCGSRFSVDLDWSEKWPVASSGRKQPTGKQQGQFEGGGDSPDPDAALENMHVRRLFLTVMGSHQGPEVDAFRSGLSKAKQAAQERTLVVQLAQTDASRSWRRSEEAEVLNAGLQRQVRLREHVAAEPATTVVYPVTQFDIFKLGVMHESFIPGVSFCVS